MAFDSYVDGLAMDDEFRRIHNRGATGFFLLFIGVYLLGFGGTMTGLAYGYEPKEGYTSLAEYYNLRCDIAGPVLLSVGGTSAIVSVILLITTKRAKSKPAWENRQNKRDSSASKASSSRTDAANSQQVFTISGKVAKD